MVIYLELYLLCNLMIHLITIFFINEFYDWKFSKKIIVSCIIDLIWMLLYVYQYHLFQRFKWLVIILIAFFSLPINRNFLKAFLTYLLLNFLLGGIGVILNISGNWFYFLITICYFLLAGSIYIILENKNHFAYYDVEIKFKKKLCIKAFFDTGCSLTYKQKPVIVINQKYQTLVKYVGMICIHTAIGKKELPCFYIDSLLINGKSKPAYGVFMNVEFDAIIGPSFF